MSAYMLSFLLVISIVGYFCEDQNESTSSTQTVLYNTPLTTFGALPPSSYTSPSSMEHTDSTIPNSTIPNSTIPNSSFESTSIEMTTMDMVDMTTERRTTITYTSTPEDTDSITNSTTTSYTDTSSIPTRTTDITTDATEALTTPEESPSPSSTQNRPTDPSTPVMPFSPTTTLKPTIPGIRVVDNAREGRYYFVIPVIGVVLLVIIILIIIYGVHHFKYRTSNVTRQASRITKLDLESNSKQEPVVMRDLKDIVIVLHKDDNLLFSSQYQCLNSTAPVHSCSEAHKDENKEKNRFINVLPFDHSRVILPIIDEDKHTDYINANFLPGFNCSKEYIATQGPLPGTIDDFWRMVWEYDVTIIVMLTSCEEKNISKCEQYWPIECGDAAVYGDIRVENTSSSKINTYSSSVLHLTTEDQSEVRVVKHFHYLTWKDMTASIERHDILEFISTIRQHITPQQIAPIVVHCSAGVGRTGTFIVLDYIMQYIHTQDIKNTIDIYGFIMKLRDYRVLIVQSESQYVFIYDCAVDLIEEKRKRLSEILNGGVQEDGELSVVTCEDKQRTTSL